MNDFIVEMFWECLSCNKKNNRGRYKKCEGCGAPRTPDSPEYMPEDLEAAEVVTDEPLLKKFRGGEDWKCRYCGSSAFRADGSCAACGSPQSDSAATETAPPVERAPLPYWNRPSPVRIAIAGTTILALLLWAIFHEKTYDVVVSKVSWRTTVHLDRYAVRTHESFIEGIPVGALTRVPLGQKHHHDERIFDHYESIPYTVQEQDGYRTESYSASVACGQTCTTTPRRCKSNKNGSATCTGGDQSCHTKYCSVTKTRQVPRYHSVVHFRQEASYRYEPRYAEWFGWSAWEWGHDRDVVKEGTTEKTLWPTASELVLPLNDGEHQRESHDAKLSVVFSVDDDKFDYIPKTEKELLLFPLGSHHRIKKSVASSVEVVDEK